MNWPIFVISLKDDHVRREKLAKSLNVMKLSFRIHLAIDGRNGLDCKYESLIDRSETLKFHGRKLADAEYACALSHQLIYHTIADKNLGGAIILEDDAKLKSGFADFVRDHAYQKADIILLDHGHASLNPFKLKRLLYRNVGIRLVGSATRCTGYSVSLSAAKFLVENSTPLFRTADWPCDIHTLETFACFPRLVRQDKDGKNSHIEKAREEAIQESRKYK